MFQRFRKYVLGAAMVAALAATAVALIASPASSAVVGPRVLPPPDGTIACKHVGTTVTGVQTVGTAVCLSFQTAFNVSVANAPTDCLLSGYIAQVYAYINGQYIQRSNDNWCEDSVWHLSSAWASNEPRFSQAQIYSANANYQILQYSR